EGRRIMRGDSSRPVSKGDTKATPVPCQRQNLGAPLKLPGPDGPALDVKLYPYRLIAGWNLSGILRWRKIAVASVHSVRRVTPDCLAGSSHPIRVRSTSGG